MEKRKPETSEYLPELEEGTYQTGAMKEPRGSSGLMALLLLVVIFLGGMCSALGIVNIRLLAKLAQTPGDTVPLSSLADMNQIDSESILDRLDAPLPQVPASGSVELAVADSDYYIAGTVLNDRRIYQNNRASLVEIHCLTHVNSTQSGIGVILTADGYILANSHVVDAAKRIFVKLHDGTMVRAALVGCDNFSDLALLYIDRQDLVPAVFSSNRNLQVDEPTLAVEIGRQPLTMRTSSIYSTNRNLTTSSGSLRLIQTCAGGITGPVFNSDGHIIGMQVSTIADYFPGADVMGTGLVVPTDKIRQVLQHLLSAGHVAGQPSLGLEVEAITKLYQQYWQLPSGLLLTQVMEDSSAGLQGIAEGDILLALDGVPLKTRSDLYAILYNHQVGDEIIAVVFRDHQRFTVTITVEDNAIS